MSHEVQNGRPCFLNSISEKSLGAAGSKLSLRLGQRFMPNTRDIEGKENLPLNYYANLPGNELLRILYDFEVAAI